VDEDGQNACGKPEQKQRIEKGQTHRIIIVF
jgi:hypothetical protein